MDPKHRDRIAFVRLCSGHFTRGMKLRHVRTGKQLVVHNPVLFLAQDRELAEEAWAGDIIGIPNHGNLRIGDALTEGEELALHRHPELRAGAPAAGARRSTRCGPSTSAAPCEQLAEEGAAQVFKPLLGTDWIVGVVGALQFDVLADRIRTEYDIAGALRGDLDPHRPLARGRRRAGAQAVPQRSSGEHGRGPRRRAGVPAGEPLATRPRGGGLAADKISEDSGESDEGWNEDRHGHLTRLGRARGSSRTGRGLLGPPRSTGSVSPSGSHGRPLPPRCADPPTARIFRTVGPGLENSRSSSSVARAGRSPRRAIAGVRDRRPEDPWGRGA